MTDPNDTYKRDYQTLRESLGRHPTANELLPLADAYKDSYSREREERQTRERADQARIPRESVAEPLSGPDKPSEPETAVSEPERPRVNPGRSGDRLVTCRQCGDTFERPARRGRPPVKCEECR